MLLDFIMSFLQINSNISVSENRIVYVFASHGWLLDGRAEVQPLEEARIANNTFFVCK
jgi:hypothetical protein